MKTIDILHIYFVILVIIFNTNAIQSQVFVSNNNFIYNKNSVVFVQGNLELSGANSTFYLRNQGQLIQGTTASSTNKGIGKLSVFQEGTVNNFAYNYWCSPVGNASAAVGNENFGITMLNVPTTTTESTVANITGSYNGSSASTSLTIASYWIWKFLSSINYSQWFHSAASSNIAAGEGFTMKGTSGTDATSVGEGVVNNPSSAQRYDFRGKPNDGNITVNVANDSFTLTGNPYPSALHVNAFLLDPSNAASTGIAYYWEQDKTVNSHVLSNYQGGYGTYAPVSLVSNGIYVPATFNTYNGDGTINTTGSTSGLSIERKYAPIGQGFMVKGNASGSLTIKNAHRAYNLEGSFSQFERSKIANQNSERDLNVPPPPPNYQVEHIRINTIMNNQYTKQLALAFVPSATDGVDRGIDAKSPVGDIPNDVYFFLEDDKYVIQGINFDIDKRVKIGIKSTNNASFVINVSTLVDFNTSQAVYLYDGLLGTYHDIKNNSHEIILPTGVYNNRFEITFKDNSLGIDDTIKNSFFISQNNTSQLLTVFNPQLLAIKSVVLYDINGKELFNKVLDGIQSNYEFTTSGLSTAVYVVQVESNDNRKTSQKVIIDNE